MIDLRRSIVILGGGLSASFAAKEFLKLNYKVVMIDAGFDGKDNFEDLVIDKSEIKPPSYKFKIKANEFAYKNFSSKLNIQTNNFQAVGSLATGGLSNIWGGGLSKFNEEEYGNEHHHSKIEKIYNEIQSEMQGVDSDHMSNVRDQDIDLRLKILVNSNKQGINFFPPINALNKNQTSEKNHNIYNANTLIDKLKKDSNFQLISNSIINKIFMDNDEYILKTENKLNGEEKDYLLKNVFCGLGVISTTKLVLGMEKTYDSPIPLKTTPMGYFLLFSLEKRKNKTRFGLSSLSFTINESSGTCSGGFFPCNEEILSYYKFFNILPKILKDLIDKIFLQRLFIGNIFFSSAMSLNAISLLKNGKCIIEGKNHKSLEEKFYKTKEILKESLKNINMYIVPGIGKLAKPGSDIHYAGTLPINKDETKKLFCNRFGKLNGHKNFFIIDASLLNTLPGKPQTLHSLAQTIIVVREFISSNSAQSL